MSNEFPAIIEARAKASKSGGTNAGIAFLSGSLAVMSVIVFPVSLPMVLSVAAFSVTSFASAVIVKECKNIVVATHRFSELVENRGDADEINRQLAIIFGAGQSAVSEKVMAFMKNRQAHTSLDVPMSSRSMGGSKFDGSVNEQQQEVASPPPGDDTPAPSVSHPDPVRKGPRLRS